MEDLLHNRLAMGATIEFGRQDGDAYVRSITKLLYSGACCAGGV